jgi:hypothetical protein
MSIHKPYCANPINNLLIDYPCQTIADYLKEELNRLNPLKEEFTIVKSTRCYDAFNIPLQDFPCLKIYRVSTNYSTPNKRGVASLSGQYGLIMPDQERLLPVLHWIDENLADAFRQLHYRTNTFLVPGSLVRTSYRTVVSELGIPVYAFLRFDFSVFTDNDASPTSRLCG